MRVKIIALAVTLGTLTLLSACSATGGSGDEAFTYRSGDVDVFLTIPAGQETGSLEVEMPEGSGVYLSGEYLLVQGKGRVDVSYPSTDGGAVKGSITGAKAVAFYTPEESGTFTIAASRGNGGDRAEPLVIEFLVRECPSMLQSNGQCTPS